DEDVTWNDECCTSDDSRYGDEVGGFVELFKSVVEAFVELTRTSQCSLSTKSSDSTSAFEHFETVMFTVPVVDLGKQSILYLGPSARSLDFEVCPNFVHTWLKPFTISPGAHDLLVGLARPFTANNFGDSC